MVGAQDAELTQTFTGPSNFIFSSGFSLP